MKRRRNGLVTVLLLLALTSIAGPVLPALAALIGIVIPVLSLIGLGFVISLIVGAIRGEGKKADPAAKPAETVERTIVNRNTSKIVGGSKLDPDQQEKIYTASGSVQKTIYVLNTIKDKEVKEAAEKVLAKANWLVKTMKEQPEEISRSNQFFIYYVPTIKTVLEKYRTIEQSGLDAEDNKKKVMEFFADTDKAFDAMYEGFFKDEKLDLEVEVEAMQMALKRDGLV